MPLFCTLAVFTGTNLALLPVGCVKPCPEEGGAATLANKSLFVRLNRSAVNVSLLLNNPKSIPASFETEVSHFKFNGNNCPAYADMKVVGVIPKGDGTGPKSVLLN